MQSCFGQNFMLILEKQDRNGVQHFYAIVQLIGSKKQSEKFAYRYLMTYCYTVYVLCVGSC